MTLTVDCAVKPQHKQHKYILHYLIIFRFGSWKYTENNYDDAEEEPKTWITVSMLPRKDGHLTYVPTTYQ